MLLSESAHGFGGLLATNDHQSEAVIVSEV